MDFPAPQPPPPDKPSIEMCLLEWLRQEFPNVKVEHDYRSWGVIFIGDPWVANITYADVASPLPGRPEKLGMWCRLSGQEGVVTHQLDPKDPEMFQKLHKILSAELSL